MARIEFWNKAAFVVCMCVLYHRNNINFFGEINFCCLIFWWVAFVTWADGAQRNRLLIDNNINSAKCRSAFCNINTYQRNIESMNLKRFTKKCLDKGEMYFWYCQEESTKWYLSFLKTISCKVSGLKVGHQRGWGTQTEIWVAYIGLCWPQEIKRK